MEKPLILIGGGGHCKSVIDVAEYAGRCIKGILDLPEYVGTECLGYKVIGTDADIPLYVEECEFIVTLGFIKDASRRIALHDYVKECGGHLAILVAPTAHVSRHASIGAGTVVLNFASLNAAAKIGEGCIVNTFANIEHDAVVEDYCHISTGAAVNGECHIGKACFIGSGAVVYNGVSIVENTLIGGGSVVFKDIKRAGTYIGNPCRKV